MPYIKMLNRNSSVLATGSLKEKAGMDAGTKGQVGTWLSSEFFYRVLQGEAKLPKEF